MRRTCIFIAAVLFFSCNQNKEKTNESKTDTVTKATDTVTTKVETETAAPQTDEALINGMLKTSLGAEWRVLTDQDVKDKSSYYTDLVLEERMMTPGFPFMGKADFNNDKKADYVALATNGKMEYERLLTRVVLFLEGEKPQTFDLGAESISTLRVIRRTTVIEWYNSYDDDKIRKIPLRAEGIELVTGDAGGAYLYWDGKKIRELHIEG